MSVRPLLDIEEDVFRRMIEPFDPTRNETEQGVTERARDSADPEDCSEGEARQPRTKPPPVKPNAEEVEKHMVTHLPFRD